LAARAALKRSSLWHTLLFRTKEFFARRRER
jgi:hypothetical protein